MYLFGDVAILTLDAMQVKVMIPSPVRSIEEVLLTCFSALDRTLDEFQGY